GERVALRIERDDAHVEDQRLVIRRRRDDIELAQLRRRHRPGAVGLAVAGRQVRARRHVADYHIGIIGDAQTLERRLQLQPDAAAARLFVLIPRHSSAPRPSSTRSTSRNSCRYWKYCFTSIFNLVPNLYQILARRRLIPN